MIHPTPVVSFCLILFVQKGKRHRVDSSTIRRRLRRFESPKDNQIQAGTDSALKTYGLLYLGKILPTVGRNYTKRLIRIFRLAIPLPLLVTMSWHGEIHTAQLNFTGNSTLTVTKSGPGSGKVTSRSAGIDCGSDCAESYPSGTTVFLKATPDPGSKFNGWRGGGCKSNGVCKVKLTVDTSVDARFADLTGKAESIVFTTQPGNITAAESLGTQPVVEVRNARGDTVTTDPDDEVTETVTVTFNKETNQEGATLLGTTTVNINWGTGQGAFTDLAVDLVGSYQLTASTNLGSFQANSNTFTVSPRQLSIVTQPSVIAVGQILPGYPTVAVQDLNGNTLTTDNSTQITVGIKSGTGTRGATLSGTLSKTVVNGLAIFDDLSIDLTGSDYVLTVAGTGLGVVHSAVFDVISLLNITVAGSSDPVEAGGQITYTLTFSNSSDTDTAREVTLSDTFPGHTVPVSASDGGGLDPSGTMVRWFLGNLAPGSSGQRTFVVQVDSPLPNETLLTNNVKLESAQGDSATANQTTTVQSHSILSLSVTDSPDPVKAGEQITYTFSFSNSSSASDTALGVTLTSTFPAHTVAVSVSDGGGLDPSGTMVRWFLENLAPGSNGERTLVVQVDSPLPNGTLLTNKVKLESAQGDSATANQTTTVQSAAELSVTQSYDPVLVLPGEQFAITISFSNSSSANKAALGVLLTNTLPANALFVSASDGATLDPSGTMITWSLGDLPPGAEGTRSLVLQADPSLSAGTLLTNHVSLEDSDGNSVASTLTTALGSTSTGENTESPALAETNIIVGAGGVFFPTDPSNSFKLPSSEEASRIQLTATGTTEGAQDKSTSLSLRTSPQQENETTKMEEQKVGAGEITTPGCQTFLSLFGSDSPDPVVVGDQIIYTFFFMNSSTIETAKDITLKEILPPQMRFISASDEGSEAGSVVIWPLGEIPPDSGGSRSVVAQVKATGSTGSIITSYSASLEGKDGVCASTSDFTTVEPLQFATAPDTSNVDDDGDGFLNQFEAACGSDSKDPKSVCYSISLDDTEKIVRRGSEVTIHASVERHFNYQGLITFSTSSSIDGVLWISSNTSAILSESQKSASVTFTIMTTSSTPLGRHETSIIATSRTMSNQITFTLEVVE